MLHARSMGLGCEVFASAAEFLLCCDALRPGCLVLDLRMLISIESERREGPPQG